MEDGLFAIVNVILGSDNGIGMLSFNLQVSEQWSCRCDP